MQSFLASAGWDSASRQPLAGDASARRYVRLEKAGSSAILMIDPDGDASAFMRIANYLERNGLSAPAILASDLGAGLLLLEDFGDRQFASVVENDPECENRLYLAATDALLTLHRMPPADGLLRAEPVYLSRMTDLFFEHYLAFAGHRVTLTERESIESTLLASLERRSNVCDVTVLRDFHAENLIWLPDRESDRQAGLLDFQDAVQGHRAYDLASLLRDVRRDVSTDTVHLVIDHYLQKSGLNRDEFLAAFAVLSVQRNLRILGVFTRLATQGGKTRYLRFLPRVIRHLRRDLEHPELKTLKGLLAGLLEPTQPVSAMLFAAGFGTRMGKLTNERPKPLISVAGQTLLDRALEQVSGDRPLNTVVNAHYHAERIVAHLKNTNASVLVETPDILDTGGGLKNALPLLGEGPVFTLNTDTVWVGENPLEQLIRAWKPGHMKALLLCVPLRRTVGRDAPGDFSLSPDGQLKRSGQYVYTGAQIICTDALDQCEQKVFSLNTLWDIYAREDGLFGCVYDGTWCDVGHPRGIDLAESALKEAGHV